MGIDSRCPNGHRVRVKDRFAGRKAYCPECGATFRVPLVDASLPVAAIVSLDAAYAATLPRATAVITAELAPSDTERGAAVVPKLERRRRDRAVTPGTSPPDPGAARAPERAAETARRLHAVIAEAPDLTWHVALPGGDPSEPLSAEMLQEWLESGGATGHELVWRADWPDWVPLRLVFPEHLPPAGR